MILLLLAQEERSSWALQLLWQIDFKGGMVRRSLLRASGQETEAWVTTVIPRGGTPVTLYLNSRSESHTLVLDPEVTSQSRSGKPLA